MSDWMILMAAIISKLTVAFDISSPEKKSFFFSHQPICDEKSGPTNFQKLVVWVPVILPQAEHTHSGM